MRKYLCKLLDCNKSRSSEEESFYEGFHGLKSPEEREAMSVLELAELLAPLQKDTATYIVLSHELNLKIAKHQAKLNHRTVLIAGAFTITGAVMGAVATSYFSSQLPITITNCQSHKNCETGITKTQKEAANNGNNNPSAPVEVNAKPSCSTHHKKTNEKP